MLRLIGIEIARLPGGWCSIFLVLWQVFNLGWNHVIAATSILLITSSLILLPLLESRLLSISFNFSYNSLEFFSICISISFTILFPFYKIHLFSFFTSSV